MAMSCKTIAMPGPRALSERGTRNPAFGIRAEKLDSGSCAHSAHVRNDDWQIIGFPYRIHRLLISG
jgi:hypothetical protein